MTEITAPTSKTEEPQFNRRTLYIGGGLVAFALVMFVAVPALIMAFTPHFHGEQYDDPQVVEDFALPRVDGSMFQLSEHRGEVLVIYFGYTSCPDICPTTLLELRTMKQELAGEDYAEDVTVVFVTIDPETDTPEKMADYLSYFDESFIGLYGDEADLQAVYDRFGVNILSEDETIAGYGLGHTASTFVIDRAGRLRLALHYGAAGENMARDIRTLLRERR